MNGKVMQTPSEPPINFANELAKERNRAAAERTLMAWIRTCLALISFGIGIDRIVAALHEAAVNKIESRHLSHSIGLAFIAIGTIALLSAALSHRRDLARIARGNFIYVSRLSLSFVVAIALILVGLYAFVGILL